MLHANLIASKVGDTVVSVALVGLVAAAEPPSMTAVGVDV